MIELKAGQKQVIGRHQRKVRGYKLIERSSYRLLSVENISVHGFPALDLQLDGGLSTQSDRLDLSLRE